VGFKGRNENDLHTAGDWFQLPVVGFKEEGALKRLKFVQIVSASSSGI